IAFSFSAFFAGVAGALAAINFEIMNAQQLGAQQSAEVLLMTYVGGVGYFGLMFIGFVSFAPGGVAGWLMRHRDAARSGEFRRLAPAYAFVAPGLAAGLVGGAMLIELANRQLALARSEGSAMNLFGFAVDASSIAPWALALVLFAGGVAMSWRLWSKVGDAWGSVNAGLRARGRA